MFFITTYTYFPIICVYSTYILFHINCIHSIYWLFCYTSLHPQLKNPAHGVMPALIQLFASFHLKAAAFSFSDGLQDWSSPDSNQSFSCFSFLNSSQISHILQTFSNSQKTDTDQFPVADTQSFSVSFRNLLRNIAYHLTELFTCGCKHRCKHPHQRCFSCTIFT